MLIQKCLPSLTCKKTPKGRAGSRSRCGSDPSVHSELLNEGSSVSIETPCKPDERRFGSAVLCDSVLPEWNLSGFGPETHGQTVGDYQLRTISAVERC